MSGKTRFTPAEKNIAAKIVEKEKKLKVYLPNQAIEKILSGSEKINSFLEKFKKDIFEVIEVTKKNNYPDWERGKAFDYTVDNIILRLEELESYDDKNRARRLSKTPENSEHYKDEIKAAIRKQTPLKSPKKEVIETKKVVKIKIPEKSSEMEKVIPKEFRIAHPDGGMLLEEEIEEIKQKAKGQSITIISGSEMIGGWIFTVKNPRKNEQINLENVVKRYWRKKRMN